MASIDVPAAAGSDIGTMQHSDFLIIGGGPAGSTCAARLKRAGADVAIIDKQSFPRDKTCAGWVTPAVLQTLDFDRHEYAASHVLQPIFGFRIGMIGGEIAETRYPSPVSYGIRRCEFDTYLLRRSGATVHEQTPLKSLQFADGVWQINDDRQTPMLIGAGGHFCPVARHLGARTTRESVVAAQEVEFEIPAADRAGVAIEEAIPELYFCEDLKGYGWCFRKQNYLNIGLGRVGEKHLGEHVDAFLQFLRERGRLSIDIPVRFHGHAYQLYERSVPRLFDEHVLLIGDSAGLAYPQSGEGIRPAVESAVIAADVLRDSGGDYSAPALAAYQTRLTARLGAPRSTTAAGWLPATWISSLARQLLGNEWFARHVVINDWFLHASQPALV